MLEQLKPYTPTEKGQELIALLFPLSHIEKEKNIAKYWNQYPQETQAIVDGFHYLVQEVLEARAAGLNDDVINLPKQILSIIAEQIVKDKNYFSYTKIDQFFQVVTGVKHAVFRDYELMKTF